MAEPFVFIPKANTSLGDKFEQLWLACSRLIVAELDCFDRQSEKTLLPGAPDPCTSIRAQANSCLDKANNYAAWEELVKCRDKQLAMQHVKEKHIQVNPPEPISCHELVAELQFHRRTFFESSVTKPVSEWVQVLGTQFSSCFLILRFLTAHQFSNSSNTNKIIKQTRSNQNADLLELNISIVPKKWVIKVFHA